jgi:hypothetical protein
VNTRVTEKNAPATDTTTRAESSAPADGRVGKPVPRDSQRQGQLFRDLMSGRITAWQLAELTSRGDPAAVPVRLLPDLRQESGLGGDANPGNPDVAAFLATEQRIAHGSVAQNSVAAASPALTFAELIEKHVRRALVSREAATTSGGEVRIELSDATLPGTALRLRRTAAGWQLVAATTSRHAREMLDRFTPALVERFERAALGKLEVSVEDTPL